MSDSVVMENKPVNDFAKRLLSQIDNNPVIDKFWNEVAYPFKVREQKDSISVFDIELCSG